MATGWSRSAASKLFNRVETGRTFHAISIPGRSMPSEAEMVHGLSDRFLSDKPAFGDRCEDLLEFIADSPLVAHNAAFDFGFINNELGSCGRPTVCTSRMIDTLAIARQKFRAQSTASTRSAPVSASTGRCGSSMAR
jgi:DNA polymerase-3 subunit epsilon